MKKEIRRVDPERGIVRVTSTDERFYGREELNQETGLPESFVWRPSVTWIVDTGYPKGRGFEKWLQKNGDQADQIARLAADRGYQMHRAIAALNHGDTIHMPDLFEDSEGYKRELTDEEWLGVMAYVQWWAEDGREKYEILEYERTLWPDAAACEEKYGIPAKYFRFAGTLDLKVRRIKDGTIGIIDFKSSLDVWPSHEMQVSAYAKAEGADWQAILQVNYIRNKKQKWKFTQVPDRFGLFCATFEIWQHEMAGVEPLQRDFPLSLSLDLPREAEVKAEGRHVPWCERNGHCDCAEAFNVKGSSL